jgi:hypothetical protein
VRAPEPDVSDARLTDPLHADVSGLACGCGVRSADLFSLAGLVHESVADAQIHW